MQNGKSLVSVIIPCYNKAKYVEEAIESVVAQTYNNIEIVVVNDGSSDNSSPIIKSLMYKHSQIKFFDEKENRGVVWARNFAINNANGEFILPLDADDTIEPTFVEKAVRVLERNQKMVVSCRNVFDKDPEDNKGLIDTQKIVFGNEIFVCASMFRKADYEAVGGYKEYFNKIGCEDWELFLNFISNGYKFYKINEKLFNYRRHTDGNRTEIQLSNRLKIKKKLIQLYPDFFLNEKNIDILFTNSDYINNLQKKRKKYRKLFNAMLIVAIAEFVIFVAFIGMRSWIW